MDERPTAYISDRLIGQRRQNSALSHGVNTAVCSYVQSRQVVQQQAAWALRPQKLQRDFQPTITLFRDTSGNLVDNGPVRVHLCDCHPARESAAEMADK